MSKTTTVTIIIVCAIVAVVVFLVFVNSHHDAPEHVPVKPTTLLDESDVERLTYSIRRIENRNPERFASFVRLTDDLYTTGFEWSPTIPRAFTWTQSIGNTFLRRPIETTFAPILRSGSSERRTEAPPSNRVRHGSSRAHG